MSSVTTPAAPSSSRTCIEVPVDVRERITSCTELDQLETWIRRAATVSTAQDLFSDELE